MQAIAGYGSVVEVQMQRYYQSLSEHDRRRYAAIEALKLGYGGQSYIRRLFGCHHATLQQGLRELEDESILEPGRIRASGGGRKSALSTIVGLDAAFLRVLEQHTAGSPMDESIKWTNLTRPQIAELLAGEGISVSVTVVDQLLTKYNYRKRQAVKKLATGSNDDRNAQFEQIAQFKQDYMSAGNPVISMDTKKEN